MRATVLAYGYDGPELNILKTACARLNIRLRRVRPEETGRPIGTFFGLIREGKASGDAGAVPGRMLVLGGFASRQTDAFLSALRTGRAGPSLKAMLTEHNVRWTGPELYAELTRERDAIEAGQ